MIEHLYACRWHVDGGNSCDCGSAKTRPGTEPSTGSAVLDDLAQRLTAMGHVLAAAIAVVAGVGREGMAGVVVPTAAFLALADAVERAQPGAVEQARKAGGR